jgi:hypothetical protein
MVSAIGPSTAPADANARRARWLLLCVTWLGAAVALAISSGGSVPMMLLAAAGLLPAVVSGLRSRRPTGAERAWLVLVAISLTAGVLFLSLVAVGGGQPRPVAPSPEICWAVLAAAAATLLLALPLPTGRRELRLGGVTIGGTAVLATAALVVGASDGAPDGCVAPRLADAAVVAIDAEALVDGAVVGRAGLSGERAVTSEHWQGERASDALTDFRLEYTHTAAGSWLGLSYSTPDPVEPPAAIDGTPATLDGRLAAGLVDAPLHLADDLGLADVSGRPARHCRLVIDGTTGTQLMLPLAWLVDEDPLAGAAELPIWRGELDWWVGEGELLRRAQIHVGGLPRDAWDSDGLRGELHATLTVEEPSSPVVIPEPLP